MNVTIESLRKSGYKVQVVHTRDCWPWTVDMDEWMLSKYEYEQAVANKQLLDLSMLGIFNDYPPTFGKAVLPTGGFTTVTVTTPDGKLHSTGKFNVPVGKNFNRKLGSRVALERALQNLSSMTNG